MSNEEEYEKAVEEAMRTGRSFLKIQHIEMAEIEDEPHDHEFDIYAQALDCYICSICGVPQNGDE